MAVVFGDVVLHMAVQIAAEGTVGWDIFDGAVAYPNKQMGRLVGAVENEELPVQERIVVK